MTRRNNRTMTDALALERSRNNRTMTDALALERSRNKSKTKDLIEVGLNIDVPTYWNGISENYSSDILNDLNYTLRNEGYDFKIDYDMSTELEIDWNGRKMTIDEIADEMFKEDIRIYAQNVADEVGNFLINNKIITDFSVDENAHRPREYNFGDDTIGMTVIMTRENLENLFRDIGNDIVRIKENEQSYDGYHSFVSQRNDDWDIDNVWEDEKKGNDTRVLLCLLSEYIKQENEEAMNNNYPHGGFPDDVVEAIVDALKDNDEDSLEYKRYLRNEHPRLPFIDGKRRPDKTRGMRDKARNLRERR